MPSCRSTAVKILSSFLEQLFQNKGGISGGWQKILNNTDTSRDLSVISNVSLPPWPFKLFPTGVSIIPSVPCWHPWVTHSHFLTDMCKRKKIPLGTRSQSIAGRECECCRPPSFAKPFPLHQASVGRSWTCAVFSCHLHEGHGLASSSGSAARRDTMHWLLLFEVYHNKVRTSLIRAGLSRKSAGRTRSEEHQLWVAPDSVCHLGQLSSSPNKGGRIIVLGSFTWMK